MAENDPIEKLQFEKVAWADTRPKCGACGAALEGTYYQFAGHNICVGCGEQVRAGQQKPSMAAVLRGALYGLGAAVAGAAGYALFLVLTNIEFALITVGIGWLVGVAVRKGAGGLGGRRTQVIAVVLAYGAITMSSAPVLAREFQKRPQGITGAGYVVVVVVAVALVSPWMSLLSGEIVSPLLGLLILLVGLYQAWKMTARDGRLLVGPLAMEMEEGKSA